MRTMLKICYFANPFLFVVAFIITRNWINQGGNVQEDPQAFLHYFKDEMERVFPTYYVILSFILFYTAVLLLWIKL